VANATSGAGPFTYTWAPGGQSTQTITGLSPGTYTLAITAAGTCPNGDTVTIIEPAILSASTTVSPVSCFGGTNGTAVANAMGGTAPYSYSWAPSGLTNSTIGSLAAGSYTVTVTDTNNCTVIATAFITQPLTALNVYTTNNATTCGINNGVATASASGGSAPYLYSWAPSGGNTTNATGLSQGTYTINTTDARNCSLSATAIITGSVGTVSIITSSPINCYGGANGTVSISASGSSNSFSYLWNTGQTDQTLSNLNAGNYCVTTTEPNGCFDTICFALINPPKMNADFISDPTITDINHPEIQFSDQTAGASIWEWDFGDTTGSTDQNPNHYYYFQGTYSVMLIATNTMGCVDTVIHEIIINDEFTFYAPNTFTPNGDRNNDLFLPKGTGWDPSAYQLWIFDRWGNTTFYTRDMNSGWNGKVSNKNKTAQMDVYAWKVQLSATTGEQHNYTGIVTLFK
jgi:gliding motility-associated-like protein